LYLWNNDGKYYNLDGNQRKRVIMATWGGDVELPYIEVEAENEKAARKEILAISSQYGEVTKEGFDEFTFDYEEMDFDEVVDETTFDGWMDKEIESDQEPIQDSEVHVLKIEYPPKVEADLCDHIKNFEFIDDIKIK